MANVIIGIHGLGNKPQKTVLEHWWKLAMMEGLKSAGFGTDLPAFELVYWADILHDKPLSLSETDPDSAYYVEEPYTTGQKTFHAEIHETRRRVQDFLGRQMNRIFLNDDFTLNYSFITDTILKRYFKDLEIYYTESYPGGTDSELSKNELIRQRLAAKLKKHKKDNIILIGHSMGSIIAFDVLTFLVPHININTFITMGSPLGIPVVISKIASEHKRNGYAVDYINTPENITRKWVNFSDILDKVAFNYKLSGIFTENNKGIKPEDHLVTNNYEINGNHNPHKSYGYLRSDEFSRILYEFIASEKLTFRQTLIRKIGRSFSNFSQRYAPGRKMQKQNSSDR